MGEFDIMVSGPIPVLDQLCTVLRESGRLVRAEPVPAADDRYAHGLCLIRMTAPGDGPPDGTTARAGGFPGLDVLWRRPFARRRAKPGGRHRATRDTKRPRSHTPPTPRPAPGPGREAQQLGPRHARPTPESGVAPTPPPVFVITDAALTTT
ncbi:MAG: hypothetical protein HOV68_14420 [Streptomycetaceae bacterium]|nr:hypothetical protein [Streptomycetaceae bacterium]